MTTCGNTGTRSPARGARWARRVRSVATLLAVVALAACSEAGRMAEDVASEARKAASEVREAVSEAAGELSQPSPPPGDDGASAPGAAPKPQEQGDANVSVDDFGGVGENGPAYLRAALPTLVVEVDVQEGVAADQAAVNHLIESIRANVDKPGGVVTAGGSTFASDRTTWSSDDLRAVANTHRSTYSSGDTAAVYVLYVRGSFAQKEALGVAYNASEVAIFPERWGGDLSQLLGGTTAVERAVLVHEMGHLFGLVNLTYDSKFDHGDPEHRGHSRHKDSVMYWAIETTAIGQVFSGPPPDTYDRFDRADLEFLRTGNWSS